MNSVTDKEKVKCLVWDLDNTLWEGILLEEEVRLRDSVADILMELDQRGIIQSIASRNTHETAMDELNRFGVGKYFLYPQIGYGLKSGAIANIAASLNISVRHMAFIDDQAFEREEVSYHHPEIMCIDAADLHNLLEMDRLIPGSLTEESRNRRQMYLDDMERSAFGTGFKGTQEEFQKTLEMKLALFPPSGENDMERIAELSRRVNQMNSNGQSYSVKQLYEMRDSGRYDMYTARFSDRFGDYGIVGFALVHRDTGHWNIEAFAISCRVMQRGVWSVFLNYIVKKAKLSNVEITAEYRPNDMSRYMYISYKFLGFTEKSAENGLILFEYRHPHTQAFPDNITIID